MFYSNMQLCLQRNSVGSSTCEDVSSSIFTAIWSNSLDSLTDGFFFTKLFSVLISKFPGWDLILWNVSSTLLQIVIHGSVAISSFKRPFRKS